MFAVNGDWLILLLLAVLLDWASGRYAAYRAGEETKSWGLRRTITKTVVYGIFATMAQGFSNVYAGATLYGHTIPLIDNIGQFAFMWLTWIEIRSVGENLSHFFPIIDKVMNAFEERLREVSSIFQSRDFEDGEDLIDEEIGKADERIVELRRKKDRLKKTRKEDF